MSGFVPSSNSVCLNLNSTRSDLQPYLADLNPILQNLLSILLSSPDTTAEGSLPPNFSKIHMVNFP